jgi:hypothetical protein
MIDYHASLMLEKRRKKRNGKEKICKLTILDFKQCKFGRNKISVAINMKSLVDK